MLGQSITLGQRQAYGFIVASQPASWLSGGQRPLADMPSTAKHASRDFGADVRIPPLDRITRTLVDVM
jgi:hypothetical protein